MKEVTFKGREDGKERAGVRVSGVFYPLNEAVVVSNSEAEMLESVEGFKFSVKDAPKGAQRTSTDNEDDVSADSGGTGGSQTVVAPADSSGVSATNT